MEKDDLREFVVSRYAALLRTAYLMVGDRDDAEDLVQVALLKAVRVWPRITVAPEAYVKKIMVNHLISHWRMRRVTELLTPLLPERTAGVADTDLGLRDELWRALHRLPRRMRAVLVLRYWEDLSESETATVLGCSIGSVKSQASRGLARLRAELGGDPRTEGWGEANAVI